MRYRCRDCNRTFVPNGKSLFVDAGTKKLIDKVLLERVSLRGICRIFEVGLSWLQAYIKVKYAEVADDLGFKFNPEKVHLGDKFYIKLVDCQADEVWSFVAKWTNVK